MAGTARAAWMVCVVASLFAAASADAQAKRRSRDGGRQGVLQIVLRQPVLFGDLLVPARRYNVTVDGESLTLTDASTMVVRATVPVEARLAEKVVRTPSASVRRRGDRVQIIVKHLDRVYTAVGVASKASEAPAGSEVSFAAKQETAVTEAADGPDELAVVTTAVQRYLKVIMPCAERAQKARWQTDDPRFERCVCPWTEKWRLPPVKKNRRVHQILTKGRAGFSFTVNTEGRVSDCRVWAGAKPPDEDMSVGPAKADGAPDRPAAGAKAQGPTPVPPSPSGP